MPQFTPNLPTVLEIQLQTYSEWNIERWMSIATRWSQMVVEAIHLTPTNHVQSTLVKEVRLLSSLYSLIVSTRWTQSWSLETGVPRIIYPSFISMLDMILITLKTRHAQEVLLRSQSLRNTELWMVVRFGTMGQKHGATYQANTWVSFENQLHSPFSTIWSCAHSELCLN